MPAPVLFANDPLLVRRPFSYANANSERRRRRHFAVHPQKTAFLCSTEAIAEAPPLTSLRSSLLRSEPTEREEVTSSSCLLPPLPSLPFSLSPPLSLQIVLLSAGGLQDDVLSLKSSSLPPSAGHCRNHISPLPSSTHPISLSPLPLPAQLSPFPSSTDRRRRPPSLARRPLPLLLLLLLPPPPFLGLPPLLPRGCLTLSHTASSAAAPSSSPQNHSTSANRALLGDVAAPTTVAPRGQAESGDGRRRGSCCGGITGGRGGASRLFAQESPFSPLSVPTPSHPPGAVGAAVLRPQSLEVRRRRRRWSQTPSRVPCRGVGHHSSPFFLRLRRLFSRRLISSPLSLPSPPSAPRLSLPLFSLLPLPALLFSAVDSASRAACCARLLHNEMDESARRRRRALVHFFVDVNRQKRPERRRPGFRVAAYSGSAASPPSFPPSLPPSVPHPFLHRAARLPPPPLRRRAPPPRRSPANQFSHPHPLKGVRGAANPLLRLS